MKNNVFEYVVRPETGGISSLVLCADPYAMNWCGHTKDWGMPVVMQLAKNRTFREPLVLISSNETESIWENPELRITLSRTFASDGSLVESYVFRNLSPYELFFRKGDIGIYVPLCDEYHEAATSLTTKCHAHIFCGEEWAWINALRQGASEQNLGLIVTEGAIDAYSIDRENQTIGTARRGNILLHPALPMLRSKEEYVLTWRVFPHRGTDDFFATLSTLGKNPDLHVEQETVMGDEPFRFDFAAKEAAVTCDGQSVPYREENGRIYVEYAPTRFGEHVFSIVADGLHTHTTLFATFPLDELCRRRVQYIVEKQQHHDVGNALDGAYLIYDIKDERPYFSHRFPDHNAARERLGMALLITRYLQMHDDPQALASLEKFERFLFRELVDVENGLVYNSLGKDASRIRLYNAPWVMMLLCELYRLKKDLWYLELLVRIARNYYAGGGTGFYPNGIDIDFLYETVKESGLPEADELRTLFLAHADNMVRVGLDYPAHEVIYEQTIVTPAVTLISEAGLITGDRTYIDKVQAHLEPLLRFHGMQPDYRFHAISIRYWDDFWFGKTGLYTDTLHYWSCLSARAFASYYRLSGEEKYIDFAHRCARNCLPLFYEDGGASCAYLQPFSTDGVRGECYDDWANDQDYALYFAMQIL